MSFVSKVFMPSGLMVEVSALSIRSIGFPCSVIYGLGSTGMVPIIVGSVPVPQTLAGIRSRVARQVTNNNSECIPKKQSERSSPVGKYHGDELSIGFSFCEEKKQRDQEDRPSESLEADEEAPGQVR